MPSDLTLSRSTVELDLRNARVEAAVDEADFGTLASLGQKPLQHLGQRAHVSAPPRFCSTNVKPPAVLKPRIGGGLRTSNLRVLDLPR